MNMALRRRALIERSLWVLPSGYQRVEYIASTGLNYQYIETGLYLTNDDILYADFMGTGTVTNLRPVMGTRQDINLYNVLITFGNNGSISAQRSSSTSSTNATFISTDGYLNQRIQVINSKYRRGIVGVEYNEVEVNESFTTTATCRIFSGNARYADRYFPGRIYLAEIVNRFFGVPCYRKSDNKAGMYDTIGQRFLTTPNGSFTKGADV